MNRRRAQHGFTLFELVLVMMIICVALAMAAPQLRGWNQGAKMRDAGDQVLALTKLARAQSIADSSVYRLTVNQDSGVVSLAVQQGENFVSVGTSVAAPVSMPTDFKVELTDPENKPLEAIDFYPTGRTQPGKLRITYGDNYIYEIECPSPAEGFAKK